MILKADEIAKRLANLTNASDPLVIKPQPDLIQLRDSGSAAVDLRLGTWLVTLRESRSAVLDIAVKENQGPGETRLTRRYYVPFGRGFILHPRCFVLGGTMEWIRLPARLAGYVVGKSSWGRRGLVIATAAGVHPGFSGCLTLELTNLGEVPINLVPGMQICQLFLHKVDSNSDAIDKSSFVGKRRPTLGSVKPDPVAVKLMEGEKF
ncbi:MAG: dCTP deaminase [Planctomycetes bacterium]|nr:dCTP deaminase [Planctomycetota bacterium]